MADDADRATQMVALEIEAGIAAARPRGEGRDTCEECDAPIPPRRRQAHPTATRCVPCQDAVERSRR